jgi:hypothetical protein
LRFKELEITPSSIFPLWRESLLDIISCYRCTTLR